MLFQARRGSRGVDIVREEPLRVDEVEELHVSAGSTEKQIERESLVRFVRSFRRELPLSQGRGLQLKHAFDLCRVAEPTDLAPTIERFGHYLVLRRSW